MTKETYFEELSYALRRRELLPRPVEEDGLLPVEWNSRILCRVKIGRASCRERVCQYV